MVNLSTAKTKNLGKSVIKGLVPMIYALALILPHLTYAADGKLIGTAGLVQLEGTGGGGIVPWATLSGYDSRDEISVSAVSTKVNLPDYRLDVLGLSASFFDKLEVSFAQQNFTLKSSGTDISQNIFGLKYRLYGDVVYSNLPQISLGILHKQLNDKAIANTLGAKQTSGTDFYLATTKVHLGAIAGYNAVWNITARATKANEMGILGFASEQKNEYQLMLEASAGILFSRHLAVGVEYRQKPDNLGLGESDWQDVFISYIPNKHLNLTLAWANLDTIAGASDQKGPYISINGQLW